MTLALVAPWVIQSAVARAAPSAQSNSWDAHWIWASTDTANTWVACRQTFSLDAKPTTALTRIAADTKYWLYVNGNLVIFEGGLKRGPNPDDTYYDETDIARYLQTGSNVIAILVWHFGKNGFSHKDSGAGGLILQSDVYLGETKIAIKTDTTWKCQVHSGYLNETTGSQPNYRLAESNIYYDARLATPMRDWESIAYDDSSWALAIDKGTAGSPPWNALIKRPIPFFRYSGLLDYANGDSFPTNGNGDLAARLPSNLQVTPYLKVDAPAGMQITIESDHYWDGGGAAAQNVRATYVTTDGVQEFESLGWLSGTSITYSIPSGVKILALKYRESGYDTDFAGSFVSNDAFFDKLWQKAARTVYLNMRDTYMDCPTRERAQWWGDVALQLKGSFYLFDTRAYALGKKGINELMAWQRSDGVIHSPVPAGNSYMELPQQMLHSVWTFGAYYLYTGDASIANSSYPAIKQYLSLWTFGTDGLVNHRPGDLDWFDWGSNIDKRVLENAWYYLALDTAIQFANLSGNTNDLPIWQAKQDSIEQNFDRVLWNDVNKEYRSPDYTGDTDDRGNALAVVAGLANTANYPYLINVLRTHRNSSPYMEFYVLEALYKMNAASDAQERMMARYNTEVNNPGYTLWELWPGYGIGTDDHGWNTGPVFALSAYAAGVRPTQPGYGAYEVVPQLGQFTTLSTTVPTVKGNIRVSMNLHSPSRFTLDIVSPIGTTGRIAIPRLDITGPFIKANDVVVFWKDLPIGSVPGLTYTGSDARYIYFNVDPGSWSFDEAEMNAETLFLPVVVKSPIATQLAEN